MQSASSLIGCLLNQFLLKFKPAAENNFCPTLNNSVTQRGASDMKRVGRIPLKKNFKSNPKNRWSQR